MIVKKSAIALLGAAATIALLSCTTTLPTTQASVASVSERNDPDALRAIYSRLGAAGGNVFELNPKTSSVRIYAFRAGRAARMGHNHVLAAPQFKGFVYLPSSGPTNARFDLEFRLDQL